MERKGARFPHPLPAGPRIQGKTSACPRSCGGLVIQCNRRGRAHTSFSKYWKVSSSWVCRMQEENFAKHLYSAGVPDPELIIRPSGEIRLSNFLLWQCAYSELYFCDTLWPDFDERTLDAAIIDYQKRDRRFGGVK